MVDYVAQMNSMQETPGGESKNAAGDYGEAFRRYIEPAAELNTVPECTGVPLKGSEERAMREWLGKNEGVFALVAKGARKPYLSFHYQGRSMIDVSIPYCGFLRAMAKGLCWKNVLADLSDEETVLRNLRTVYGLARHLQVYCPTVIEQLVGMSIQKAADRHVLLLIRDGKIGASAFPALSRLLDKLYVDSYPELNFKYDEMMGLDTIQRTFSRGGLGGGHLCPRECDELLKKMVSVSGQSGGGTNLGLLFFAVHPRRNSTEAEWKTYFQMLEKFDVCPYDRVQENIPDPGVVRKENSTNVFLGMFLPGLERTVNQHYRTRAGFEATETVVAVLRYRHEKGKLPASLDELVPGYLREVPRDPYGAGSLVYKQEGEEFLIYSLGSKMVDDGGKPAEKDNGWGDGKIVRSSQVIVHSARKRKSGKSKKSGESKKSKKRRKRATL